MDLEKFAKRLFELSAWPEGGDIDAFDFQETAVECGLLTPETRTEPCNPDNCHCAEHHGDMSGGVTCYRKASFLMTHNVELCGGRSESERTQG